MGQDAYKNGPMFFRLETAAGSCTHAGLLEFSAAEGFVALPLKVGEGGAPAAAGGQPAGAGRQPAGCLVLAL